MIESSITMGCEKVDDDDVEEEEDDDDDDDDDKELTCVTSEVGMFNTLEPTTTGEVSVTIFVGSQFLPNHLLKSHSRHYLQQKVKLKKLAPDA